MECLTLQKVKATPREHVHVLQADSARDERFLRLVRHGGEKRHKRQNVAQLLGGEKEMGQRIAEKMRMLGKKRKVNPHRRGGDRWARLRLEGNNGDREWRGW